MNKRLLLLEQMTSAGKADAFAWYGLAMEYRRLGRAEDALQAFESLRSKFADYLAQYLMAGQLLKELGRTEAAREWLQAGFDLATTRGDMKTRGELEQELAAL
ncbi:MAG TPA: tetratricopeptide repeat protein [Polyangiaceae bacterium]|jgi:predicted Zn-dependent protease|nr:tetratricopeptide repeat protein [Polyangiaceae bacterium]